jgi:hypothetical protein
VKIPTALTAQELIQRISRDVKGWSTQFSGDKLVELFSVLGNPDEISQMDSRTLREIWSQSPELLRKAMREAQSSTMQDADKEALANSIADTAAMKHPGGYFVDVESQGPQFYAFLLQYGDPERYSMRLLDGSPEALKSLYSVSLSNNPGDAADTVINELRTGSGTIFSGILQAVSGKMFGAEESEATELARVQGGDSAYASLLSQISPGVYQKLEDTLQNVYDRTQEYYETAKLDSIPLYRGVDAEVGHLAPVSSWSSKVGVAGQHGSDAVVRASVPVSEILSSVKAPYWKGGTDSGEHFVLGRIKLTKEGG